MPPTGDSDDDWAELARELSRDKPPPLPEPEPPTEELGLFGEGAEELATNAEESPELQEGAADEEGEGPPDGQPGTGRKRRRRRRRRRRGGEQPAEGSAGEALDAEETQKSADEVVESSDAGFSDEDESDSDLVPVDAESSSDEDAGEELLRDLIANWNVPSWDDVVGGLYRPER
jgi:ribonuclease E